METTHINFTFPTGKLEPEYLNAEQCKVEFGPITDNHIKLAILLIRDQSSSKAGADLFIDDLIELTEVMMSNPDKNAFEIMREELTT